MTTFFGKAANTGVSERPLHTLSVTPTIALATETEKVVSETHKEMNIEFGKQIGEMVVSETSSLSLSLSAHAATAIPVEEIFCDAKMQHMQHATEARENIQKMLLLSTLSKIQQMSSSTATISNLLTEYRYEMYKSTRERMHMIQHIWGLSFQDKSNCEVGMTSTLIQGMVGAYSLTEKYRNEIAKLRLKLEHQDEALHDLERELARKNTREHLPEIAIKLAAVIENQGEKSTTLLSIFSDLLTNNIKETKRWNDDTKSLFLVVLDYGGPALLRIIQEKIGGPSLQTAYATTRSIFHTPTKLEESTFVKAASFYDRIGYHGPFIIAIDATAILPCIRVKGNKLVGIATEEDIVVKTAQDIFDITGNESMEKAR